MDMTIDLQDFSRKTIYEMVETTAYFEAYNPILEGLQQTKENDLPFQVSIESVETFKYSITDKTNENIQKKVYSKILKRILNEHVNKNHVF